MTACGSNSLGFRCKYIVSSPHCSHHRTDTDYSHHALEVVASTCTFISVLTRSSVLVRKWVARSKQRYRAPQHRKPLMLIHSPVAIAASYCCAGSGTTCNHPLEQF